MSFAIGHPSFADMVRLHGKWLSDKTALVDDWREARWGDLDAATNRVANGLKAAGIGKGDAVAILMGNCIEYVEVLYGVFKAGAVVVPLNLAVAEDGLLRMLADCGAKAAFFTPDQWARLKDELASLPAPPRAFVFDREGEGSGGEDYRRWRDGQSGADPRVPVDPDAPCNIIYSSGTTGVPKGIKHVYGRRMQSMYELALAHRYHFEAVSICPIGLYSNIAWASLFCALITGGTCVIRKGFDVPDWLAAARQHRATHTFMAPILFQRVLDHPDFTPDAVASFEAIISGGSPLFPELKARIEQGFPGCAVMELYGLTEGFMTILQPEEAEGRTGSVGKPVRGNDYILVDEAGAVLPFGATGEICVRSVHWMVEYHNRPDATEEARFVDPDGVLWLRTGDIGRTDADGYLYITDRKKDMIVSGGQNIYPVDLEAVLSQHPAVAEVAVIGVAAATWGETPVALVVLRPGIAAGEALGEVIRGFANARLGKRQRVSRVVFREALPRNPNGKVQKHVLRKVFAAS